MTSALGASAWSAWQRADGFFPLHEGGGADLEATAWATVALTLAPTPDVASATRAASALAAAQRNDGRLSVAPPHPGNYWPTAVAVLAWVALGVAPSARERALDFLESHRGDSYPRPDDWPLGHDPALAGWPWVDGTSSWVEPTALVLLALAAGGRSQTPRAREGRRLLLDRQIASGGWNYGNTSVFGRELLATPESTGLALAALAEPGEVVDASAVKSVEPSLRYLAAGSAQWSTPLALAWTTLGLATWGARPLDADARLLACAASDPAPGEPYDVIERALLGLAAVAPQGLLAAIAGGAKR